MFPDRALCDLAAALVEADHLDDLPSTGPLILPGLLVEAGVEVHRKEVPNLDRHQVEWGIPMSNSTRTRAACLVTTPPT
jgi:hypothetical protein